MIAKLRHILRDRAVLELPKAPNAERLNAKERKTLVHLTRVLAGDEAFAEERIFGHLDQREKASEDWSGMYRWAIEMLNDKAISRHRSRDFSELSPVEGDRILSSILKSYPYRDHEVKWRQKTRLTRDRLDAVLGNKNAKLFRNFVVRDLLNLYFKGKEGWALVGRDCPPGHSPEDGGKVTLSGFGERGGRCQFEFSDGTFEPVRRSAVIEENGTPVAIRARSGRQRVDIPKELAEDVFRQIDAYEHRKSSNDKPDTILSADVVIVGSGPIGAAAAKTLVEGGLEVVMLEGGERPPEDRFPVMEGSDDENAGWSFEPWEYEESGDSLRLNLFSYRIVGGSSLGWGAVSPRFHENDLRLASKYGVALDWPISYDQLEPAYMAAERFMGVSGGEDNPFASWRSEPLPMGPFPFSDIDEAVADACDRLHIPIHSVPAARNTRAYEGRSRCINYAVCRACPIGAMYSSDQTVNDLESAPNFHLYTGARVRRVLIDDDGNASGVLYVDSKGAEHELLTDRVILATQAIENVRLLMISGDQKKGGLGNSSGQLGRHLCEHVKYYYSARVEQRLEPYVRGYETGTSMKFHDHPDRKEAAGSRLLIRENPGPTPAEIAVGSGQWGAELREEIEGSFGHWVTLGAFMEQLPYEKNHVTISDSKVDRFGDPVASIEFKLMGEYEEAGFQKMSKHIKEIYAEMGATDVRLIMEPSVSGHYMGCHRMGENPEDSVVDPWLESHDVPGLYLASSGALPTGGISNPTLTTVALALRMADQILNQEGRESGATASLAEPKTS